jgi:hypothetical protein
MIMSKAIYNLFLIKRLTERWLRLAPTEQTALLAKINEGLAASGGRRVIGCNAYWCNQGYRGWGVEEFPDFASWCEFTDLREKLEWYSYSESWSMLGTWHEAVNPEEVVAPESGKIYQLFLMQGLTEAYEQLTQAENDALWAKEGESRQDAKWIVAANSYWASEEYQGFGVFMFPNIDAVQHHFAGVKQIGWPRYMRSRTLLGTLREA